MATTPKNSVPYEKRRWVKIVLGLVAGSCAMVGVWFGCLAGNSWNEDALVNGNLLVEERVAALKAMGRSSDPHTIEVIIGACVGDDTLWTNATPVLRRRGKQSAGPLVERMIIDQGNTDRIAELLVQIGPPAVEPLLPCLNSSNHKAALAAAAALGKIGDSRAREPLTQCLGSPDVNLRRQATVSLAQLGGPQATAAFTNLLRQKDPDVVLATLNTMGGQTASTIAAMPEIVPTLAQVLTNSDTTVRRLAAQTMARIASGATTSAVPNLVLALVDDDSSVRQTAGEALTRIDPNWARRDSIDASLEHVTDALQSGDTDVHQAAVSLLVSIGTNSQACVKYLIQAVGHTHGSAREAAITVLQKIRPDSKEVRDALIEALKFYPDEGAVNALAMLGDIGFGPDQIASLTDDNSEQNRVLDRILEALRDRGSLPWNAQSEYGSALDPQLVSFGVRSSAKRMEMQEAGEGVSNSVRVVMYVVASPGVFSLAQTAKSMFFQARSRDGRLYTVTDAGSTNSILDQIVLFTNRCGDCFAMSKTEFRAALARVVPGAALGTATAMEYRSKDVFRECLKPGNAILFSQNSKEGIPKNLLGELRYQLLQCVFNRAPDDYRIFWLGRSPVIPNHSDGQEYVWSQLRLKNAMDAGLAEYLEGAIKSEFWVRRAGAILSLPQFAALMTNSVPLLVERLDSDPARNNRVFAAQCLAKIGNETAAVALAGAANDPDPYIRITVGKCLNTLREQLRHKLASEAETGILGDKLAKEIRSAVVDASVTKPVEAKVQEAPVKSQVSSGDLETSHASAAAAGHDGQSVGDSLPGTIWRYTRSDNPSFLCELLFASDSSVYVVAGGTGHNTRKGVWRQQGKKIYFDARNGETRWQAELIGNWMTGTASSEQGDKWNWSAIREATPSQFAAQEITRQWKSNTSGMGNEPVNSSPAGFEPAPAATSSRVSQSGNGTLTGTSWTMSRSDMPRPESGSIIQFEASGVFSRAPVQLPTVKANGTWRQEGANVFFEVHNNITQGFARWQGDLTGSRMAGKARDSSGRAWDWSAIRNPDSGPTISDK